MGKHRAKLNSRRKALFMRRLYEAQSGICRLCGAEMSHPDEVRAAGMMLHLDAPSLDHIIPVSHGGVKQGISNLWLVHKGCNEARGTQRANPEAVLKHFREVRAA